MKTLNELQTDREHLIRCANDIRERSKKEDDRSYTSEEKADLANFQQDIARLDNEIQERRTKDQYDATIEAQLNSLSPTGTVTQRMEPNNTGELPKPDVVPYQRRFGKLRAFRGPDGERKAFRSGKFLQAALFGNQKADRWCTSNGLDWRALSVGTNTAGGFLVPEEMASTIIDLREEYGVFRRECRVVPMTRDMMTIPRRAAGVTATFTGENAALTESDATFNQVTLSARKLGVLTRVSSELSEDSIIDIADYVAQDFAQAFAYKEDLCGFNGTGALSYGGIVGAAVKIADGNHGAGFVAAVTAAHDTFGEIDSTDLGAVMGACPQYALANAKWYCSGLAKSLVFDRLAAAGGGNTIDTLAGKTQSAFLGYPIVVSQVLPAGAATDYTGLFMLGFGDLAQAAALGDRREITVSLSPERYFEYDQIGIRATERFDISVHDLGDGTTAGPWVALKGGSG